MNKVNFYFNEKFSDLLTKIIYLHKSIDTLWYIEKVGDGYVIKNKYDNKCMGPADPKSIDNMIYMQDDDPETNFIWKFLDKDENVLSPESIDDLKNCSYIK